MARTSKRARRTSWTTSIFRMLLLAVSGGGIGGYFKSDLPILGPLVHSILGGSSGTADVGSIVDQVIRGGSASGQQAQPGPSTANASIPAQLASSRRPSDRILIATFNIQVFGESKLAKREVMRVITEVVRQFDVVAIQEIRAQSDDVMPELVKAINADGSRYSYLVGERLGRTVSTEQYAFVYDTTRIEHEPNAFGTMADKNDLLHREPFVARLRARTQSPQNAFTFWLVNTHTDPDEVPEEVAALAEVFQVMQAARPEEDDVILLGDLNASESELGPLGQLPGMDWVVRGATTNTRQTKAYDNILFRREATGEYTGRWGVMNLEPTFGLTRDEALSVSDHLPVWAEFSAWETAQPGALAERSNDSRR